MQLKRHIIVLTPEGWADDGLLAYHLSSGM